MIDNQKWMDDFLPAFIGILLVFCILAPMAMGDTLPKEKVIPCLIGEAESSGYTGMLAIAHAIRNRGHLKGVYGCNAPRVKQHKYSPKTWVQAIKAWEDSRLGQDITLGATGWGNDSDLKIFARSRWWRNCDITVKIGGNNFYTCNQ